MWNKSMHTYSMYPSCCHFNPRFHNSYMQECIISATYKVNMMPPIELNK